MKVKELMQHSVWMPNPNTNILHTPIISIILPTYRRFKDGHFERCVDSLLAQTFSEFELIIVDDFSYDGTFDRIKKYMEQDDRISCIRHLQNVGLPAISTYEAFCKSRGQYFGYAFDDCIFENNAYEILLNSLKKSGEKVVCGSGYIDMPNSQNIYFGQLGMKIVNIELEQIHLSNFLPNPGFLIAREVFTSVGHYDPHISLLRLCDWDLWRRILKKYNIHLIDDIVVHETSLSDSLGNAFELDFQIAKVQMCSDRTDALSTERFPEYDVVTPIGISSALFLQNYTGYYKQNFSSRAWFSPLEIEWLENDVQGDICVETSRIDDSVLISFKVGHASNFNLFYMHPDERVFLDFLGFSGCTIQVRDLFYQSQAAYSIPTYYFIDDVFSEIKTPEYEEYTHENMRKKLRDFAGVIVSTPAIAKYYTEHKLHDNCIVFPAVYRTDILRSPHQIDDVITFAFQGGKWRKEIFIKTVLPALKNISKKYQIRLVCPEFLSEEFFSVPFTVIPIKFNYDYEKFIQELSRYNIDIVLHPAPPSLNNKFKEVNALLNASLLGAALVTTNEEPYTRIPHDCIGFCENTPAAWESAILDFIETCGKLDSIVKNAQAYSLKYHSGDQNNKVLTELSKKHPMPTFYEYRKRVAAYSSHANQIKKENIFQKCITTFTDHGFKFTLMKIGRFFCMKLLKAVSR